MSVILGIKVFHADSAACPPKWPERPSCNKHQRIVDAPEQAAACFLGMELDTLCLGD
jgi:hypothetical protein